MSSNLESWGFSSLNVNLTLDVKKQVEVKPDSIVSADLYDFEKCRGSTEAIRERWVFCIDCFRYRKVIPSCGQRNCPRCQKKQSKRILEKYGPAFANVSTGYGRRWIVVNLTGFDVPRGNLVDYVEYYAHHVKKFLKKHYLGGLVAIEHTYHEHTKEYFVHAHALCIGDYQNQEELSAEFGRFVWVQDFSKDKKGVLRTAGQAVSAGLRYVVKYISKGVALEDDELESVKGMRYIWTFGELYNLKLPEWKRRCKFCYSGDLNRGRLGLATEDDIDTIEAKKYRKGEEPLEIVRVITWPVKPPKEHKGYWENRKKELDEWWRNRWLGQSFPSPIVSAWGWLVSRLPAF